MPSPTTRATRDVADGSHARRVDFPISYQDDAAMASKTTVELIDDVDGKPAAETITFGIDGREFEIDLTTKNAKALRAAMEPFLGAGRRISGRVTRDNATKVATGVDNQSVRKWAESNGYEVSARGRISGEIVEAYRAAGN
jgi:hypothetical protein